MLRLIALLLVLLPAFRAAADAYTEYIDTYAPMAVAQQEAHGIPASITLAQGLLESAAGRSTLARRGNNHFGIKCHRGWKGDTLLRSDDAPNECFRSYATAAESFADHSRFLMRERYAPLFRLDPADYAGWARTLRSCGYATDPQYADRLVAIIERYALYLYDTEGGRRAEEDADYIRTRLLLTHPVRKVRGLHYVIATPGDTYGSIAREFGIDKKKLLRYNDMKRDGEIKDWEEVYLQPKAESLKDGPAEATVGEGESMHSLSQRFGLSLSALRALNPGVRDCAGSVVRLR